MRPVPQLSFFVVDLEGRVAGANSETGKNLTVNLIKVWIETIFGIGNG